MDKQDLNNILYVTILLVTLLSLIAFCYIIFLLSTDGPMCMLDPLAYAKEQGLEFIELKLFR